MDPKPLLSKLFSGRYILTVICGIVFFWCVVHKQLEDATIAAILISVFKEYFDRSDRGGTNGTNGKTP